MANRQNITNHLPEKARSYFRFIVVSLFILLFSAALSIPFYFETMTLWYKTGADKTMLRLGQLVGISAMVLLLLQIILAVQGKFLGELFGRVTLSRYHKINGGIILLLAFCHVFLVLIPEGLTNLPIGKKYWPEMIGGVLLILLVMVVISSYFRNILNISFKSWRTLHRPLGYICLVLLLVHVVFVSDSFEHSQLRATLIFIFATLSLLVIVVKILQLFDT